MCARALAFCSQFYEDVALNELAPLAHARLVMRLAPGTLLLETGLPRAEVERHVAAAPPVFTRQLLLDATVVQVQGNAVVDAAAVLAEHPAGTVLVCDLEGRIGSAAVQLRETIESARSRDTLSAETGASPPLLVVLANDQAYVGPAMLWAGLRSDRDGIAPYWPGGRPQIPYEPDLVSRSALKLLEALETFAIPRYPLGGIAGKKALDLGAAPGGWTQVLAMRGVRVTAVDPGRLHPRVLALAGVSAQLCTAQEYLRAADERFDLIVNDMRLDAHESSRIMVDAAALLQPGGWGLITLKLPRQAPTAILRRALAILRMAYPMQQARSLYFDRGEVTVYVRRGGP